MSKDLIKMENNAGSAEILNENDNSFCFYNASLGRRILSYLADLFISFILCLFVCEIIYLPIAKTCIGYNESVSTMLELGHKRYDLLYENELLYFENAEEKYNFDSDFEYTGDIFTKFYVLKDKVGVENLIEDPIIHYYRVVASESSKKSIKEVSLMYYGDSIDHEYFEKYDYEKSPYLSLKEHYVNRWAPYFDENDTVSDEIIAEIKQFKLLTFRNPSLTTITEFQKNNEQYTSYSSSITSIQEEFDFYYQICAIGAFLTVFICLFVVTPLVDKKGRTLGKIFLKLETIHNKKFTYLEKKWRIAVILLTLLEQMPLIMFIPFISVGITEIFTLPVLFIVSLISIAYLAIDLVITISNKLNYSIKELLTSTVVVDKDLMDKYYREVVYGEEGTTSK